MFLQVCFPNANLALWSVYPLYGCIVLWKKDSIGNLIYNIIADSDYFIFFLGRFGLQVCNLVMISILTSPGAYGRREDLRYVKWLSCFFFIGPGLFGMRQSTRPCRLWRRLWMVFTVKWQRLRMISRYIQLLAAFC